MAGQMIEMEPDSLRAGRAFFGRGSSNRTRLSRRQSRSIVRKLALEDDNSEKIDIRVRADSGYKPEEIEKTRNKLKSLFDTPCEKFKSKKNFWFRKLPWKLIIQLLKVVAVTCQLIVFSGERGTFEKFSQKNRISFHHVFLQGWGADREVLPYPPVGDYALYTRQDLYDHLNFALYQFYRFEDITLSSLVIKPSSRSALLDMELLTKAERKLLNQSTYTYDVDATPKLHENIELQKSDIMNSNCSIDDGVKCFEVERYLNELNVTGKALDIPRLISLSLKFDLTGISRKLSEQNLNGIVAETECVDFKIQIIYDNSRGSGQIGVKLEHLLDMRSCDEVNKTETAISKNEMVLIGLGILDISVMVISVASLVLAVRSFTNRAKLARETKKLFEEHFGYQLTIPEMVEIVTLWYFQYFLSDSLVIVGSILKMYQRYGPVAHTVTFDNTHVFNAVGIMLSLANLSQWIGLIRYLGYFKRHYILILTISNSVPALVRFLVCGMTIFLGFMFSGWIVLGPYNPKFETISTAALSLFSLVNGDEIYATMSIINYDDHPFAVYLFSCAFLYSYILLFIFAIANLFIAVIMDSYETVKSGEGFQKTLLHHFKEDTLHIVGKISTKEQKVFPFRTEEEVDSQYGILSPFLCCLDECIHHSTNTGDMDGVNQEDVRIHMGGIEEHVE